MNERLSLKATRYVWTDIPLSGQHSAPPSRPLNTVAGSWLRPVAQLLQRPLGLRDLYLGLAAPISSCPVRKETEHQERVPLAEERCGV